MMLMKMVVIRVIIILIIIIIIIYLCYNTCNTIMKIFMLHTVIVARKNKTKCEYEYDFIRDNIDYCNNMYHVT